MQALYTFLIVCYGLAIRIASLFDTKAALWVKGRRDYFTRLEGVFQSLDRSGKKIAWFHCASLGEFEQGRPIIDNFRKKYPDYMLLLTFYSPSGFEVRKVYPGVDWVFYLPLDTRANARRFVETVKPDIVFYVKYEFWFNFLSYIQLKNTPSFLISAIFRPEQHFFKWYGEWPRKVLEGFTKIFVQNESSKELLQFIGIGDAIVCGDTRFDRVATIASLCEKVEIAEIFAKDNDVMVAGSTWPEDEELLIALIDHHEDRLKFILAPHELKKEYLSALKLKLGNKAIFLSQANASSAANATILIIDSIGLLSRLYHYGILAYIGGGFGAGIHNILEPAAFGLPVFFGPNYHKFEEAKELVNLQGAFSVKNKEQLILKVSELIENSDDLNVASSICRHYVHDHVGATQTIMNKISEYMETRS